jgi:hypothetical protein
LLRILLVKTDGLVNRRNAKSRVLIQWFMQSL